MSIIYQDKDASGSSESIFMLAKGTGLSFCGEIGHVIITYAYGIVIARFIGVSNYGIFFLGITIFNLLVLFSQCGIEDGLMRFLGPYIQRGEEHGVKGIIRFSLLLAIGLGALFGSICFLSSDLLAEKIFHKPDLATVLRHLSLAVPISAIMIVSLASIRGFKIVMPYVLVRKIFMPLVSFAFAIAVLIMGCGVRGLTVAYILGVVCSAVLATFLLLSFLSPFTKGANSRSEGDKYFSFVGSAFVVNILLFLFLWSDLIVLGIFRPSGELGIYFAAKKTALILSLLLVSLNTIFVPVISHSYSGHKYQQLDQAYKASTQWILMLGLPLFLVILFFSRGILSLFGPDFETGQVCLIVLAFGQLVNISVGSVGYLLMMTGHQNWMVFNSIFCVILNIPLVILLVPHYGLLGAAYANGFTLVFANLVGLLEVYFLLRLHPYNTRYFKILFSGVITAAVTYLMDHYLPNNGSVIFSLMQASLVFVMFFVLIILFGLEEKERRFLVVIKHKLMPLYVQGSFEAKK